MLNCCKACNARTTLTYEDLVSECGRCREAKKADMVPHAEEQEKVYFGGKRWDKGRKSTMPIETKNAIIELYEKGFTQMELADLFKVSQGTISNIIRKHKEDK